MNIIKIPNSSLQLHSRDLIHAESVQAGSTIVCEQGVLWLTRSNDLKDYMLKPGDRMQVSSKSDVLIQALADAHVSIVHPN